MLNKQFKVPSEVVFTEGKFNGFCGTLVSVELNFDIMLYKFTVELDKSNYITTYDGNWIKEIK